MPINKSLFLFDSNLNLKNAAKVNEGAVSLKNTSESFRVTVMGAFSPTDQALGFVMALPKKYRAKTKSTCQSFAKTCTYRLW